MPIIITLIEFTYDNWFKASNLLYLVALNFEKIKFFNEIEKNIKNKYTENAILIKKGKKFRVIQFKESENEDFDKFNDTWEYTSDEM